MNEVQIKQRLIELAEALNKLLRSSAQGVRSDGLYVSADGNADAETVLQELSLQIKYLMFDLEATRRENRYLRQILENRPKPSGDEPSGGETM